MAISSKFDRVFRQYVPALPVEFVRALSYRESRLNPENLTPPGASDSRGARGLMQVMTVNREDYNAKHGTAWSPSDMFSPAKNVRVFAGTIGRMLRVFRSNRLLSPDVPTRRPALLLVTAGWNSGYGDVLRIADWLRDHDLVVNHDNLFSYAKDALPASSQRRWTTRKRDWQRSVVRLYEQQGETDTEGDLWGAILIWYLWSQR